MGGDGRNHVQIIRQVLADGGFEVGALARYPMGADGVAAVVAAVNGRHGQPAGVQLAIDAGSMAGVYAATGALLGAMVVLLLLHAAPETLRRSDRLPPLLAVAAASSVVLVASAAVTSTALVDGFLSAYAALALLALAAVLASDWSRPAAEHLANRSVIAARMLALVGISGLLLVTWSLVAPLPLVLGILLLGTARTARGRPRPVIWAGIATAAALVLGSLLAWLRLDEVRALVTTPGSVVPPAPAWTALLIAIALVLLASRHRRSGQGLTSALSVIAVAGTGAALTWLLQLTAGTAASGDAGAALAYYPAKVLWMSASASCWIMLVPGILALSTIPAATGRAWASSTAGLLRGLVVVAASTGAAALVVSWVSPLPSVPRATSVIRPSASVADLVFAQVDQGGPWAVWDWSRTEAGVPDPEDDRLGNFWSTGSWDPAGTWAAWAYTISGPDPAQLCPLLAANPSLRIVTRNPDLSGTLRAICPLPFSPEVVVDQ